MPQHSFGVGVIALLLHMHGPFADREKKKKKGQRNGQLKLWENSLTLVVVLVWSCAHEICMHGLHVICKRRRRGSLCSWSRDMAKIRPQRNSSDHVIGFGPYGVCLSSSRNEQLKNKQKNRSNKFFKLWGLAQLKSLIIIIDK